MIQLQLKNGYYWHRASRKGEWKIVRLLKRCQIWTYYFDKEYYTLLDSDILEEIVEPK